MGKKTEEFKLKVPWGHVAAKAWGDSEKKPVLMVHGIMDNAGAFNRLVQHLPENFYYVCIDLPGHGWSSHFPPGIQLNYFSYVLAIKYVLDELKWKHLFYIGHSFGAHLGALFTLVFPERIEKLILIDSVIAHPIENQQLIRNISSQINLTAEALNVKSVRYTKDEIMYGLMNLRKCCLNFEAAKEVFERSVTEIESGSYVYNRDYRLKLSVNPQFTWNQSMYLLKQMKVKALLLVSRSSLPFMNDVRLKLIPALTDLNNIKVIEVLGNHDVHNNNPENISSHIIKFLAQFESKL